MNESYGKKFILDGELHPSEHFDNSLVYGGDSIYEVIRMMRGIPVFFHDHMERLEGSLKLQGKARLAGKDDIRNDIIRLVRTEKRKEVNLKLVFNYNGDTTRYLIYFVEPVYPSDEQYRNGVKGVLVNAERQDPGSKVINHRLRSSIYHKLILEGGYEALLVNRDNEITEGSRSNIFFLKGNTLVTAPDNRILSGITRKYILDICREQGIKLEFYCLPVDSISACDAVFMTGTSPMVLQFHTVGDSHFRVPVPMIDKLRKLYIARVVESLWGFVTGE
ncbi:MAG: aminotransferase class IV family protein [Bacteroidales bacterium]|nr:aminotransferase class IV family protein [Bacteroidales bacterium]